MLPRRYRCLAVASDWRFARKPFWIFSHGFAASVILVFVVLGLWQLDRLGERRVGNQVVESRVSQTVVLNAEPEGEDLDYQAVLVPARFLEPDLVRIGNRSQGGVAGEYVVAVVELADGSRMAVNRGFVPLGDSAALDPVPEGPVELEGWLRNSVDRGSFGATDTGEGRLLPRLDTERVADRFEGPLAAVWLQLAPDGTSGLASFPDPVPLPPIDEGPHLSYAVQWFIFAVLGSLFYGAVLRRQAKGSDPQVSVPQANVGLGR